MRNLVGRKGVSTSHPVDEPKVMINGIPLESVSPLVNRGALLDKLAVFRKEWVDATKHNPEKMHRVTMDLHLFFEDVERIIRES